MPKACSRENCSRPLYDDSTAGLCLEHERGARKAASAAVAREGNGAGKAPAARKPRAPAAARAQAAPRAPATSADLTVLLARAGEALALVDAIGWDLSRSIAARVRGTAT